MDELDPRRWVTLAISILAAFIVALDATILNVSIPTIMRDLHTTLPALEWVIAGYALTFASLLIIGGRLGDVYGHRRVFIVGAALFAVGSLVASMSTSVGQLILGEAVIEGIGASLMLPSTLAILSGTFQGRERAIAFAWWGATAGIAAATGPVVGGFFTTTYSWRWSFRLNVIIAPLAVAGAIAFMPRARRSFERIGIDLAGAVMVTVGMFLLVLALSQGGLYGWWRPIEDVTIAGHGVWPATRSISVVPILFGVSFVVLLAFVWHEFDRKRDGRDPLVDFSHLRYHTYRYGLLTAMVVAMGQLGVGFTLPVFLQDAKHLTAQVNGLWMLPTGLFVIVGAQVAGRLAVRFDTAAIVRWGLTLYALGVLYILRVLSLDITLLTLLPGLAMYGSGAGAAGAQVTNIVLSEIPPASSGVASGANSTMRQVGGALGVSVIGSLLTIKTISSATSRIAASSLSATVKSRAVAGVHAAGSAYAAPPTASGADAATIRHAVEHGLLTGTRWALGFAVVMLTAGALLSRLIPRDIPAIDHGRAEDSIVPASPAPVLASDAV